MGGEGRVEEEAGRWILHSCPSVFVVALIK